jgi:hypothetical protein
MDISTLALKTFYHVDRFEDGIIFLSLLKDITADSKFTIHYLEFRSSISYEQLITDLDSIEEQRKYVVPMDFNQDIKTSIANEKYLDRLSVLKQVNEQEYNKRVN